MTKKEKKPYVCPGCGRYVRLRIFPFVCKCGNRYENADKMNSGEEFIFLQPAPLPVAEIERRISICKSGCDLWNTEKEGCNVCGTCGSGQKMFNGLMNDPTKKCPHPDGSKWGAYTPEKPRWITSAQRAIDTLSLVPKLPHDLTAIVGVARSGIAPATELAMVLQLPLFVLDQYESVVTHVGGGFRARFGTPDLSKVLIVDDTCGSGFSLSKSKPVAEKHFADSEILWAVIYKNPYAKHKGMPKIDFWVADLPDPHFLEWNLFNSPFFTNKIIFDMDGIVCHDWPGNGDGNYTEGDGYAKWLTETKPLYLPRYGNKDIIVTGRLEKHREATQAWLTKWGIHGKKLVMWQGTEEERWKCDFDGMLGVSRFKAEEYSKSPKLQVFVESNEQQASQIALLTKKLVVCPPSGKVF